MTAMIRFAACVLWAASVVGLLVALTRLRRIRRGMADIYDLDDTPVEDRPDWGQR